MNALIVLPSDTLGGAEKKLKIIAQELAARNLKVYVVFLKKRKDLGWDDCHPNVQLFFSKYSRERGGYLFLIKTLRNFNKNFKIDYVFSSNVLVNGILGMLRYLKILKTKYLVVRESTLTLDRYRGIKGILFRMLYLFGYPYSDLVICQTDLMKDRLLENMARAVKWRTLVIPNPIDMVDVIKNSKDHKDLDLLSGKEFIVGVGRLIPLKGFDLLIESFSKLSKHLQLVILGQGVELDNLKKLAVKLGVDARVHFLGFLNNPYPIMKQARVCAISSRIEGFPNTLLQMMCVNESIVSTVCAGGIDEIEGVITCEINNVDKLTKGLNCALSQTKEQMNLNRLLFDAELMKRTPKAFVDKIFSSVKDSPL